tara:strand:+ start:33232 stop:33396 length:165 start_codon:yes stop_codon:yes gene_type:complete
VIGKPKAIIENISQLFNCKNAYQSFYVFKGVKKAMWAAPQSIIITNPRQGIVKG